MRLWRNAMAGDHNKPSDAAPVTFRQAFVFGDLRNEVAHNSRPNSTTDPTQKKGQPLSTQ
jgi:hypothetical protein